MGNARRETDLPDSMLRDLAMDAHRPCRDRPRSCCGSAAARGGVHPWLLFLLAAALAPGSEAHAQVRIAGVVYLGDLPTVVAEHDGLFAAHGVDAVVELNVSGRFNLARLRAGETEFALMALTPLVLDRMQDATPGAADDPVVLASLVHSIRLNDVVTLAGSGIETPADLRGRRIALAAGTNAEFVWWLFSHFHEIDPNQAQLVDRPVEDIPLALARGEADAAVVWQPWTIRLEERFGDRLRRFPGAGVYSAKWLLVTTRGLVAGRPGLARQVLAAYRDAIERIEREPGRAIDAYARRSGVAAAALRRSWSALDYDLSLDWSLVAAFREQLDWARRSGHPAVPGEISVVPLLETGPLRTLFPAAVGVPFGREAQRSPP